MPLELFKKALAIDDMKKCAPPPASYPQTQSVPHSSCRRSRSAPTAGLLFAERGMLALSGTSGPETPC